jgi:UDPglucose 6-dehydrogenase
MATLTVIGAGYVGLPTAACFAHLGFSVTCVDSDVEKVERLARGEPTLAEPGMAELLDEGLREGRLRFASDVRTSVEDADFVFLCLPTPPGPGGATDLSAVHDVAAAIAPALRASSVVVLKSTMPVGSAHAVGKTLRNHGAPAGVQVAANPEFLREGAAVQEFLSPRRVVIGAADPDVAARVAELYAGIDAPRILTDLESAEMIKYAANCFLATKISYINEVAVLCEALGARVDDVVEGLGYDPRIGFDWLRPGPGWGGSCLPKDTAALLHTADAAHAQLAVLRAAVEANDRQRHRVVELVASMEGDLAGATVAVWGLTFKAGTDDLRDSPALDIARLLAEAGATVQAYDPAVPATRSLDGIDLNDDPYDACRDAAVLAVLTEWDEFRRLDLRRAATVMRRARLVDARNLIDPELARGAGFEYQGLGR